MQSTSPISGRTYNLPKKKNDKKNIDLFLLKNKGKKVIVVQGLGFVGSVMSLVCANSITEEYAVIGIDLLSKESYWKIRSMNEGDFPVIASDPKIDLYYKKAISKGNLYATYDPYAFSCADTIIVDINLDVSKSSDSVNNLENYEVDLSGFKNAIRSIGENCKDSVLILIETTVPPGTCENIILPEIKNCLKKRNKSTNRPRSSF